MKLDMMKASAEKFRWDQSDEAPILVKSGVYEVRLARSDDEVAAAQALRYKVFFEEMKAIPTETMRTLARDFDDFDNVCDHLLAFDTSKTGPDSVIATYRLLREEKTGGIDDFYSAQEYDISNLFKPAFRDMLGDRQLLELGRSCVHADYRTNNVMQIMWRAIARYIDKHKIGYLFGCASLPGINPDEMKLQLSYLYNSHKTPEDFNIPAVDARYQKMDFMTAEEYDDRMARRALAPLVKGYLRLGCYIGDGAVVDEQFNTTDVFILLPVDSIQRRYLGLFDS
ncbi:GNAT family N-acetyltransferase [Emcibacter sp.]|uniref:GNAT family N-acetyltransferase n=1 Tax=Emcibacter sp. TaxID=1979954 RepID=UPI002AA94244|nr:GNAT family N-acyltransferase [Emcibacter sp.]